MTTPAPSTIVQRLWNYCNVLRDDGMSYGDYVEQLTYLLFLKMDHENSTMLGKSSGIPAEFGWATLLRLDGDELERHYRDILAGLGQGAGLIPVIFRKAQNKIQDPAKLRRLIELIDGETWIGLDIDVKGEIYEGLLEKNAQDTKSGAGQYFTPRPLIKAIVDVMRPQPGKTICDPACGTGGFLLAAHDYIAGHNSLDRDQPGSPSRPVLRHGADQSALRQEVERHLCDRRRRDPARGAEHRPRGLLDLDQQQTVELRPACALDPEHERDGGGGRAG
jgi:type I restriction enzyme M protein